MIDVTKKQNVSYCIPLWCRDEQIRANVKRVSARLEPSQLRSEPIAIVGYGPSLNTTWQAIHNFKYVMTCSGAHRFLIDRGVIPTWHVDVDPREHKIKLIGQPHPDVEYLMASCVHPKMLDLLEGFNLKLWHVFADDNESHAVIPRGEWAVTGGCDAGMRCMTIARFLGFQDFHLFGIDGSEGESGKHAAAHPNQPKTSQPVEYQGKTFNSTPALAECARQVFHELDQLKDVKFKFYGDGLIQHMAKFYVRNETNSNGAIAFNRPELISEKMRKMNAKLHQENASYGVGGGKHVEKVLALAKSLGTQSILDYGAGKGYLAKGLPFPIWEYDPAIPEKAQSPRPAALVVCTDVLEHIEPDKLTYVLDDLKRVVEQVGYFVIHTGPAQKTYSDGRNTHLIQQTRDWWKKQLSKFFTVAKIIETGKELHCVVSPKVKENPAQDVSKITEVRVNGTQAKFYTPNTVTRWRAETLLTKEPVTIDWIKSMAKGEVLFDVGANVGGYSVWAGVQGIKVYSFEPEAQNYSLLVQNLMLNSIEANAYCLALSDERTLGSLYLSELTAGGSCHSFNEAVGPNLTPRPGLKQGCFGLSIDELVNAGLPHPDHVKIDVDGFEFKVIKGATKTLQKGVRSLLVEVNLSLEEHQQMLQFLQELGYQFSQAQVDRATRKDGPFKGVAEHIFTRAELSIPALRSVDGVERHLLSRLVNAQVELDPFPYLFIEEVWPTDLFSEMQNTFPKRYKSLEKGRGVKGYPQRFVAEPTGDSWVIAISALKAGPLKKALIEKFGLIGDEFTDEALLIRDKPGYAIGPHTDSPLKVISALFYLPIMESDAGTSLYVPKDPDFRCAGGPHYPVKQFNLVKTLPFKPNSLFAFLKSDISFHGVEKTTVTRDILLYDVQRR